ncbi:DUF975 family protein [Treponema parvum]|uniref:DUF975 family protein n=1 Tax=Treponema parvum TaxID=138851 RepID=UPI001AEBF5B2|nr:DUF975 family protein [Treponema parvum]QTQ15663.1 DUF975 family protein [Treponema parvum]
MFDSALYKKRAKAQLKGRRRVPMIMTAIFLFIITLLLAPSMHLMKSVRVETFSNSMPNFNFNVAVNAAPKPNFAILYILVYILITAQLYVYLKAAKETAPLHFNNFLDGLMLWFRALRAGIWFSVWVSIWSFLFVIPGIIKAFSYSQIFFLIAEYPKLSVRKAMKISKILTKGYKGDLFVMRLSFIGWYMLSVLTCGIGFLWLCPYAELSFTNAYLDLKEMAFKTGRLFPEDLQ